VFGTNCFPALVPSRFFLLVAAYCFALSFFIAFLGRYRSPVALGPWVDGLPDLVCQSSLPHLDKDFCLLVFGPLYPPPAALYFWATSCAFRADHCPALPPFVPALTAAKMDSRRDGLVYPIMVWNYFLALLGLVCVTTLDVAECFAPVWICPFIRCTGPVCSLPFAM